VTEVGEVAPFEFAAPLTVCIDFKNPFAYLAVEPTRALEARLGFAADWIPLLAPAVSPPKPASPADDRGARHRRIRAEYFERDLARYAASRGVDLGDICRPLDVETASAGLAWLRGRDRAQAGEYVQTMYERFWLERATSADVGDVAAALAAVGADGERFMAEFAARGATALAELQARLAAAGLFSVPSYVVEGDVFVGRQHLPMVEWILTGRRGRLPI